MLVEMTKIIRRALLSVSDKQNLVGLARALRAHDIEILSTGGTAQLLVSEGIAVVEVSEYTGFPEMMDGRVKTLHPVIHGGILGRRGIDDDVMAAHNIQPIDLVVVNLYPFQETTSRPDCNLGQAIEHIDIGGPTLLRAAAKNHADVAVVVEVDDYRRVEQELDEYDGAITDKLRFDLAVKAYEHSANYDNAVANYLGSLAPPGSARFPRTLGYQYIKKQEMRYGENPHQAGAFYTARNPDRMSVSAAAQIQGKQLSYNNIADTDAALECVKQFASEDGHACTIVKHANPCGVAAADSQVAAYRRAWRTDPESAFGGIVAFNTELQAETASAIMEQQFVEVIIAPHITDGAAQALRQKPDIRALACATGNGRAPAPGNGRAPAPAVESLDFRKVNGGLLAQQRDDALYRSLDVVTRRRPDEDEMRDLLFAWKVAKYVKSNAIVYAAGNATIGIGAGQMSRVNSARIAAIKAQHAGLKVAGAVMASDAFFPFRDGLDNAARAGIRAVIQPGGSRRDDEVIEAANEYDMAMIFTGMRHFRH